MSEQIIETEIDARGVATVRLNRPEVNNAYNGELVESLIAAMAPLQTSQDVRLMIIRGNGRHFQAGADLAWVRECRAKSAEENLEISKTTARMFGDLTTFPKPTIAIVHGGCFGGGTGLAAACDIVIAAEDAIFSITEARWGLVPMPILPQLISRLGPGRTRRYTLSSERFDGRRAFDIGFADEISPMEKLDEAAAPIIEALLATAPEAQAETKAEILRFASLSFTSQEVEQMAARHAKKRQSAEAEEGLRSFLEKRKPSWYPQ